MDGKLMTETIHLGKDNVFLRFYYENGNVLSEIPYPNGAKSSTEKEYYENGKLKREVIYPRTPLP